LTVPWHQRPEEIRIRRTSCTARSDRLVGGRSERLSRLPLQRPRDHPAYTVSQRIRKRVEEAFGWAKTVAGLCKMRHRGLLKFDWQSTLAMAAYNLVRLPKLLA
jgi:hypothetical protein